MVVGPRFYSGGTMLRSSRFLVFASLCLAGVPVAKSDAVVPRPHAFTATPAVPSVHAVAESIALTRPDSPVLIMRFQKTQGDSVDRAAIWSPRAQKSIQKSAFDNALRQTFSSRDFSPGTFAGSMLDSLVAFAGSDNVIQAAKSYRPSPDQYRVLLRAIRDRNPGRTSAS